MQCTDHHTAKLACPVDHMFVGCNSKQDASCTRRCSNATKPFLNAVYRDAEPRCQWECAQDTREWVSDAGMRFCRPVGVEVS
jgi:hypothetical protein